MLLEIRPYLSLCAVSGVDCTQVCLLPCGSKWLLEDLGGRSQQSVCVTGVSPFQRIFIPSSVESGACSPEIMLRVFLTIVVSFCPVVKSFV